MEARLPRPKRSRLLRGGLLVLGLLLALLGLAALARFTIDLTPEREAVADLLGGILERPVTIDGPLTLTTSLWPAIRVDGVRIGNPPGFDETHFATVGHARLALSLPPLLLGNLHVRDIALREVRLELRENRDGAVNWTFATTGSDALEETSTGVTLADYPLTGASFVLDDLRLEGVEVNYRDADSATPVVLGFERVSGQALEGEAAALDFTGHYQTHPFEGRIALASLLEFLDHSRSWARIELAIADTEVRLDGALDVGRVPATIRAELAVSGASLASLDRLVGLDLPPLQNHRTTARMRLEQDRLDLEDFTLQVGESRLNGQVLAKNVDGRTRIEATLAAPRLQLRDFAVAGWSPDPGAPQTSAADAGDEQVTQETTGASRVGEARLEELLDPAFLADFDARVDLQVGEVLDGDAPLGQGRLLATLDAGRINFDPLTLDLPGGAFNLALSVKPGDTATHATLRAFVDHFDFGLIVRRTDPQSEMGGHFSLDIDLETRAATVAELFENASGHLDLAAQPVNLKAGIVDLWAVNLLSAIATNSSKEPSRINCIVGRFTLKDGVMAPETFVIDTSQIRICGRGEADFRAQRFDFNIAPRAKRPEFFSLATPFTMRGSFDLFDAGIDLGGLVGSSISFVTSPLHVPLRRLGGSEELPEGGGDICTVQLERERRVIPPTPGCPAPAAGSSSPADAGRRD